MTASKGPGRGGSKGEEVSERVFVDLLMEEVVVYGEEGGVGDSCLVEGLWDKAILPLQLTAVLL